MPRVPCWTPIHGLPVRKDSLDLSSESGNQTGLPIRLVLGWEYLMPAAFVTTTNAAPVSRAAAIAMLCTTRPCGPAPPGSPASTACCRPGCEARACATARDRYSYCWFSCPFRSRCTTAKPAARVTTRIATIMMTTWVERRCRSSRRRGTSMASWSLSVPFTASLLGCFRSVTRSCPVLEDRWPCAKRAIAAIRAVAGRTARGHTMRARHRGVADAITRMIGGTAAMPARRRFRPVIAQSAP